jgi:cell division septation protein DedD
MTLKIGKFNSAGEAMQTAVGLGVDGHTFSPVRDPLTNRYTLHFGEFTGWKDAIAVMEAIKAKDATQDVVVWPIPRAGDISAEEPSPSALMREQGRTRTSEPKPAPIRTPSPVAMKPPPALEPAPEPAEAPAPVASATDEASSGSHGGPTGPYVVRVASYKVLGNASTMLRMLLEAGFRTSMDRTMVRGEMWYRVHATHLADMQEAQQARARIARMGRIADGATVVRVGAGQ